MNVLGRSLWRSLVVLALASVAVSARAETPASVKPEDVGLSSAQLRKIEEATRKNIDEGIIPGAVMLVARRGKVAWVSAQGKLAPGSADPMKTDSIFRIYSMTKPIVTIALMQMVEEGRLQVTDPVSKYLPGIGNMKVGTEVTGPDGKPMMRLSEPSRPMTVQDLMRHTSGLTYGSRGTTLIHQSYNDAKIGDRTATVEEMVSRLSRLALRFNPGERWEYSVAVDVQGRLLEVLSGGKRLSEVLNERVLQPLGMNDTSFQVPAAKLARVAQPSPGINGKTSTPRFKVDDGAKYESGGGGLTSTTEDYLRFVSALANNGSYQGKRIIGKQTLAFMTADHTMSLPGRPPGFGFGLGFEVRQRVGDTAQPGSVGEYGWSGAAGTTFWVDPKEQLFAIYMVQANDADTRDLRMQFRTMVEAALLDWNTKREERMKYLKSALLAAALMTGALMTVAGAGRAELPLPLPMAASPEEVGLSSVQLKRLEAVTKAHIDEGLLPGAVMLVARKGKVAWVSVQGKRDVAAGDPMKLDSIFRIYSMTKPMVSIALMQMVEEGRLQISDPVSKYLPEIGRMKVGTEVTGADGKPVLHLSDPSRPMTVQDLLRHTAGLTYGSRGASLINESYVAARIGDRSVTVEQMVSNLSKLALKFNPGDRWEYSVAVDVQGRLLEVLSGKKLHEVLAERVWQPLGMVDTGFQVPAEKVARAAQPGPRLNGQPMTPRFKVDDGAPYESGGGGALSTMGDYLRFTAALANGGALQGKRIIGKQTLAFMTADHTRDRPGRPPGMGFGLGFEVRTRVGDAAIEGSVGEYGWAGNAGTLFWIDPKEQLIAIYMVQVSDPDRVALRNQFRTMVQAAIID